jgi:hypothetical protein
VVAVFALAGLIVSDTLHTVPDDGSTAWTTRSMAARHGVGKDTVARVWRARNLRPWEVDTFKLSNDPEFENKLVDVVGLYMDPPERAVVFSSDEKTQCQALDRTQPSLPMKPGRGRTMTAGSQPSSTKWAIKSGARVVLLRLPGGGFGLWLGEGRRPGGSGRLAAPGR